MLFLEITSKNKASEKKMKKINSHTCWFTKCNQIKFQANMTTNTMTINAIKETRNYRKIRINSVMPDLNSKRCNLI